MANRLICWDLDETLGCFRRMELEYLEEFCRKEGIEMPEHLRNAKLEDLREVVLKPGISKLLADLSRNGFAHVLTTSALDGYAQYVLEKTCLSHLFDRVFTRESVFASFGKKYKPVIDAYRGRVGVENIVIVGDNYEQDRPVDITNTVMVYEPDCFRKDSSLLYPVFKALCKEGCTIRQAFDSLYNGGVRSINANKVVLNNDGKSVSANVDYFGNYTIGEMRPVITEIELI